MNKNDGGPAFPFWEPKFAESPTENIRPGMSLRDWFAGMALQIIAHDKPFIEKQANNTCEAFCEAVSEYAYDMADALLSQREE